MAKAALSTKLLSAGIIACACFFITSCQLGGLKSLLPSVYQTEVVHTEYFKQDIAFYKAQVNPDNLIIFVDESSADYSTSPLLDLFEATDTTHKLYFKSPCPNTEDSNCGFEQHSEQAEAIMEIIMAYSYPASYDLYIISSKPLKLKSFRIKDEIIIKDINIDLWVKKQHKQQHPWQK